VNSSIPAPSTRCERTSASDALRSARFRRESRSFDPEPLKEIAQELFDQLPDVSAGRFDVVGQTLTAVDGSVVETLARVARLSWLPKAKGASLCGYRLHTQFEVLRGVPSRIDVTPAKPKGEDDERAMELTDADRAAGVVSDEVVLFGRSKAQATPDHAVRIVTVKATPHSSRGKRGRNGAAYRGTPQAGVILLRAGRCRSSLVRRRRHSRRSCLPLPMLRSRSERAS